MYNKHTSCFFNVYFYDTILRRLRSFAEGIHAFFMKQRLKEKGLFEQATMFRQQTEQAKEVFDRLNVQLAMQGL